MTDRATRVGLRKVIYSVDEKTEEPDEREEQAEQAQVREAVEESFPASDPPGFVGGSCSDPEQKQS